MNREKERMPPLTPRGQFCSLGHGWLWRRPWDKVIAFLLCHSGGFMDSCDAASHGIQLCNHPFREYWYKIGRRLRTNHFLHVLDCFCFTCAGWARYSLRVWENLLTLNNVSEWVDGTCTAYSEETQCSWATEGTHTHTRGLVNCRFYTLQRKATERDTALDLISDLFWHIRKLTVTALWGSD